MGNVHIIPNTECDEIRAAMDELLRILPEQAKLAKVMQEEFIEAGFTDDEALQLVAYAVFH